MRYAKFVLGGAIAAAVPLGALPAYATGPPSPPLNSGCTFHAGKTTCVTTQHTTTRYGPITLDTVPGTTDFGGGVTGVQLCEAFDGPGNYPFVGFSGLVFDVTTTTTTTTVRQGVSPKGPLVSQSSVTQSSFTIDTFFGASC